MNECSSCIFQSECTPSEKLLQEIKNICEDYNNINNFYSNEADGENEEKWIEMSYNRLVDNLYNYCEDTAE